MPRVPPTTAIDLDKAGTSPCCNATLELSSPPNIYECRECMNQYDTSMQGESEGVETCQATTADGDPCQNAAGADGYCHLASHGPE